MLMRKFLLVLNCRIISVHRGQLLIRSCASRSRNRGEGSFRQIFVEVAEDFAILFFQLDNSAGT